MSRKKSQEVTDRRFKPRVVRRVEPTAEFEGGGSILPRDALTAYRAFQLLPESAVQTLREALSIAVDRFQPETLDERALADAFCVLANCAEEAAR